MNLKKIAFLYHCVFVFTLSVMFLPVNAESLNITVLEKGTGDPVVGATVVLGDSDEYDITDKKGVVVFDEIPPVDNIKILNSGYETLQQPLIITREKKSEAIFYLYPISVNVEGLEVITDRIKEKISKITLVKEELRSVPGTAGDPLKVLTALPGITQSSGQGGPGAIYVRGSGADDNGVLINRIPVNYLYHFGDLSGIAPSVINPSLVEDFNAFLGGFPVEYRDKLGGILDVKLRKPKNDRLHQIYRLAVHESAFLLEGPVAEDNDKDSFYVAGRMSYLDRLLTPEIINKFIDKGQDEEDKGDFSMINLPRYYDAQANWHRDLQRGYIDTYFFAAGDSLAFNLNFSKDSDPELLGDLTFDYDYQSIGFNWFNRYSNSVNTMNTLSARNFTERQQIGADKNTGKPFFVDVQTVRAGYDPEVRWNVKKDHEIILGVNTEAIKSYVDIYVTARPSEDNTNQTFSSAPKYKIDTTAKAVTAASYIKHNWRITPKLKTSLGLRYSKISGSNNVGMSGFSPRGSLEYQLTDKILLLTSWGKYLQMPEGSTLLNNFGNPSLVFMQSEHKIVGLEYKYSPTWTIKTEVYNKNMKKLVLIIPNATPPNNYTNQGKGDAYGFDLLVKREFSNRTLGWLSYSYGKSSRTTVLGEERNFSGDQPHTLNVVWSQPFWGNWKRWTWGIKMTAHSGRLHTPVVGRTGMCQGSLVYEQCSDQSDPEADASFSHWEPIQAKQNSERLPAYYQMSIRFDREIRFNTWKMKVFLDMQNLSYRKNIIGYNYGKKYEKINNRESIAAFYFPLPLLGVEAEF